MAWNQLKLFLLSVCFAPILNLTYADTKQGSLAQTHQEVYEETKGLWYLSASHTHFAMPKCHREAQLLTVSIYEDQDYPYDFTRFCIDKNDNKKTYTLPIMTNTEKENHWLLGLHEMKLGWLIDRLKPEFIDLNFHASWIENEDNAHSMRCHSVHSQAEGNNSLCKEIGQRLRQPSIILVGDNPSEKSDFTMLLSREPALDQETHQQAMDTINQIYKIKKYPKKNQRRSIGRRPKHAR